MAATEREGENDPFMFPQVLSFDVRVESERRDAAAHRQQILAAARRLFAEHGVENVSMHQVAQAAQVGQGTLYRRFAHKGFLCMTLLEEQLLTFQHDLLAYFAQASDATPILDQIDQMLVKIMYFTDAHAQLLIAMLEAFQVDRRLQSNQSAFYLWLREVMLVLLRRGVRDGTMRVHDLEYMADLLLLPLSIDFYHYQRFILRFDQSRIAEGWRRALLDNLKAI